MRAPNCATGPHCRGAIINCIRFAAPAGAALGRRRRGARVRTCQPIAEQMRRLVGGAPVKRHERGGNAGHAHDVRPPAICGDRGHLDQVRSTPDRFFKAMDNAGHSFFGENAVWRRVDFTRCQRLNKRSESRRLVHRLPWRDFSNYLARNIFSFSLDPQEMHHSSTAFAQPAAPVDLDRHFRAHYA